MIGVERGIISVHTLQNLCRKPKREKITDRTGCHRNHMLGGVAPIFNNKEFIPVGPHLKRKQVPQLKIKLLKKKVYEDLEKTPNIRAERERGIPQTPKLQNQESKE